MSIFVSPPGMQTRGSGYTDFSYTCLTLGNLLVAVLFFAGPAQIMRISFGAIAILLLADLIIIAAVPRLRVEEGWVGLASIIWAFAMAVWAVATDRIVEWGKHEEEERLTGRPEMRRTLKEWVAILTGSTILVVYLAIVILLTATLILRSSDVGLEPDGERYYVDGGKYAVHYSCVGNATTAHGKQNPTILLESGEEPSELDFEKWAFGAFQNGTMDRYCYWDRPGYAWSDNAPSPHSAGMSASALSEVLGTLGEEGPWISVSAGYGSIVARIFTARRLGQVNALMMIDPLHEDLLDRIASPGRGFKLWGYGIVSPLGIQRLAGAIFKGRTKQDRVYGRSVGQTGKFLKAKLQENLVAASLSKSDAVGAGSIQDKDTPVVIVSSGIKAGSDNEWKEKQRDLTHYTENLVSWDIVGKAPHQVWRTFEGRQLMEKRLGELVKAVRNR